MSDHVNEMVMESYFNHAVENFGFDDDTAAEYAKMRFDNEGGPLTEAQTRSLVGAPTEENLEACVCGIPNCLDAYAHTTSGY